MTNMTRAFLAHPLAALIGLGVIAVGVVVIATADALTSNMGVLGLLGSVFTLFSLAA